MKNILPSSDEKFHQGFFNPKNKHKYKGNPAKIIYRSSYELNFMLWLDRTESVLEWTNEEVVIPYKHPIDGNTHRYFPDFKIKVRDVDDNIVIYLIEVKPKKQTCEPKVQKRKTKSYIYEVTTWAINKSKWDAAKEYCARRGWKWQIITEDDLNLVR